MDPVAGLFSSAPDFYGQIDENSPQWSLCYALANNAATGELDNEAFLFDGQTQRVQASISWPVNDDWTLSLDAGGVIHSGGFLDPLIEGWHGAFGLPNGIRDSLPSDALRYELRQDGLSLLNLTERQSALSDTRVHLSRRLLQTQNQWFGAQLTIKLPTGRFDNLSGSGATDVSLGFHWHWQGSRIRLRSGIGYSRLGVSDFGSIQRRNIGFAKAGLNLHLTNRYSLDVGLDLRQPVLKSNLRAFSDPAAALHAGLNIETAAKWRIRLGFSEDIRVESEPDVVFRLMISRH
ncbi:MAG: DUF3187 family protein [Pseudomonadota bacterium]